MKNAQVIIIAILIYLLLKGSATKAEPAAGVVNNSIVPSTADLQNSLRLLQDRVNAQDIRIADLEASPYQ